MAFQLFGAAAEYFDCEDREVLNESGARTGKGGPLSEIVWTPTGPTRMGALSPGDFVCGGHGEPTRVVAVHELGPRAIFLVRLEDGSEVRATDDHLWLSAVNGGPRLTVESTSCLVRLRKEVFLPTLCGTSWSWIRVKSITRVRDEVARCIQVEARDGLYLTNDRIVTHNTHSELVKARFTAEKYPGSRQLFARETRKSLTETVLPDWENKVLGSGHAAIGRRRRSQRDAYHFPNGSDVVLHGLDDPMNLLSGEFDRIYVFQAEQLTKQEKWDSLLSRLSGSATPYCQATADANPGSATHWLIKRVRETLCLRCATVVEPPTAKACQSCGSTAVGRMKHIQYRHQDNPLWFDHANGVWRPRGVEYLTEILGRLRGVQRKRLLEHQWVSESGLVLEEYDPDVHSLSAELVRVGESGWELLVRSPGWQVGAKDPLREARVPLDWFGCGSDWGWSPDAGVFQVWGYDRYGRRFRVVEVYQTKRQVDWWAGVAEALYKEFRYRYIACDPSAPALMEAFNRRLGAIGGRSTPMIAIGADNTIRRQKPDLAGIDLMRWGLRDPEGVVRTYLVKDATRYGLDMTLREAGRPTCTEEEVVAWVFGQSKATGDQLEKPADGCDDHGLAAWRYEIGEGYGVRHAASVDKRVIFPDNSAGQIHRHAEKMAKARAQREME